MSTPPPTLFLALRAPRTHLDGSTPAVMRFQDGTRVASKLQVVSSTGGLLALPQPVAHGSQVRLMFLTGGGSVFGHAELLKPVSAHLQPFRFVSLPEDDKQRLGMLIQQSAGQEGTANAGHTPPNAEDWWIEKFRAASLQQKPPRKRLFKRAAGAVGFITLFLAGAMYLFHFPWPK
jgi:hypothetical protein